MNILVKFATRERPDKFRKALKQMVDNLHDISRVYWLFSLDTDDPMLKENEVVIADLLGSHGHRVVHGSSASKVHALNRDINEFTGAWDIVLVVADDMLAEPMWDVWVHDCMAHYFPDGDGLLWFYDGYQQAITTIPLMGRKYYDRTRYIYFPEYLSVFCDDEQTEVAALLGKLEKAEHILFRHAHPANDGTVTADDLHKRNETQAIWDKDKALYQARLAQGFPQLREHV